MKLSLTVCDVCQDTARGARTYRVQSGGRAATTDLCDEHNAPLEAILKTAAAPDEPVSEGRPRRGRRNRTTTMEEIEALKAARRQERAGSGHVER
ncbi:hypothetical protein ACNTMW_23315 [Planosporangium sp. 12N6]|uniref:hypothetical protein n=1 Tax=Planosporangium spinosum TaxID=3402278 RepID=UPI003CEF3898